MEATCRVVARRAELGAGGEYKLTHLHSKTRTFSLAEGLMD